MTGEVYVGRGCPDCGPVSVRTDRIRRTSTASGVREQWPCPLCQRTFSQQVQAHGRGAAVVVPPPITEDELIAFGLALEAAPSTPEPTRQPAKETRP